jgi:hypothetical protein
VYICTVYTVHGIDGEYVYLINMSTADQVPGHGWELLISVDLKI